MTSSASFTAPDDPALSEEFRRAWPQLLTDIADGAVEREQTGNAPYEAVKNLQDLGFGRLRVPKELGGENVSFVTLFELVRQLGAADPNVAHIYRNHFHVLEPMRDDTHATDGARWLGLAHDGALFATAISDQVRTSGPDATSGQPQFDATIVNAPAEGVILSGAKQYTTGSLFADWIAVWALDERSGEPHNAVVLVPQTAPGVHVADDWLGFGQRFTGSGTATFDNVAIPETDVISTLATQRFSYPYRSAFSQLFLTTIVAGIAQASLQTAVHAVRTRGRNTYGASTTDPTQDPIVQHTLGELSSLAFAAEATVQRAAADLDRVAAADPQDLQEVAARRHEASLNAAHAKVVVDHIGTRAATLLFDAAGASLTARPRQLDRHWRNARTLASHNPTPYKAQGIGAHRATGHQLPPFGFF